MDAVVRGIRIVVSFVLQDGQVPAPIVDALHAHVGNSLVQQIVVVSESAGADLVAAFPLLQHPKFVFFVVETRPSFSTMIELASQSPLDDSTLLCVMNADISFASTKTLSLALTSMADLAADDGSPVAFCLTRYDLNKSSKRMILKNSVGLPNLVSADCWLFSHPPLGADFYYCPGQMFCDQFLAHDLVQLDYRLFNPCLDIITVHHESTRKGRSYYRELSSHQDNQAALTEHWKKRVAPAGKGYIGLVHVYAQWIKAGYRPRPVRLASGQRRIYLMAADGQHLEPARVAEILRWEGVAESEVCVLVPNKRELAKWREPVMSEGVDNLYVIAVSSAEEVLGQLLSMSNKERTFLTVVPTAEDLPSQWPKFREQFDCVVVCVGGRDTLEATGSIRGRERYSIHVQGLPEAAIESVVAAARMGVPLEATSGPVDRTWIRQHLLRHPEDGHH